MSLTDTELFDIIEPKHPCAGTATLSLEDVQLRVQQKMQDLKIDERMASSKEAISRTWVSGSSKVRGAVGSALAGIDQYRQSQRKTVNPAPTEMSSSSETTASTTADAKTSSDETNGSKRDSFVGSWASWAAEKRKRAFQKPEPPKIERPNIGPAAARPLAQWANLKPSTAGEEATTATSEAKVDVECQKVESEGQ
jgi:hypothetical protein